MVDRIFLASISGFDEEFFFTKYTGVIWYFEPHGKLNLGSIYIHGILNPLIENEPPTVW
jgi:hypothetical protein